MGNISYLGVYKAWKAFDNVCLGDCVIDGQVCLVCLAKSFLLKFNRLQRRVDKGALHVTFPEDNRAYDKEVISEGYNYVTELCGECMEHHNNHCYIFHTRNALELILFGKKLQFKRLSFLHFLMQNGAITEDQFEETLLIFQELNLPIGSIAFVKDYLTQQQVVDILNHQKTALKLFGEAAKELKLLTDYQIESLLSFQSSHSISTSQVAIGLEFLTQEECDELFEQYKKQYCLDMRDDEIHSNCYINTSDEE